MRKWLLFLLATTNVNFSLLIISCDNGMSQVSENQAFLSQNDDEKIMQQFINEVKNIDLDLSEENLAIEEIRAIVLNKLNAFIKQNKKYQSISVTIEKISKINKDDYIISYLPLLQQKQHIKFASTLTVSINMPNQNVEVKSEIEDEKDQLQVRSAIEIVGNTAQLNAVESLSSVDVSNMHENNSFVAIQHLSEDKKTAIKEDELPLVLEDQQETTLASKSTESQTFSLDYQEKFMSLQKELRIERFEYDLAQTTYSDFITTILVPWLNQKLTNINYKLDLVHDFPDEVLGNAIADFSLNITFNDDKKTKQQLSIQVKCKEKATQAYNILTNVWTKLSDFQKQNIKFEDLPSKPNYSDIIKRFEAKLKGESDSYQNVNFIFKGIREKGNETTLLKKGKNNIYFTVAIDNKSFFYLSVNYNF